MNFETLLQTLVFGFFVGSLYGVAAIGLSLVFGVMKILNVAHGELMMLAGYVSYFVFSLFGIDPFVSILISIPVLFCVGLLLDRLVYRRIHLLTGEAKIKNSLLVSFGLSLILQALAIQFFTADERAIQASYSGYSLTLGGIILPYTRLISLFIIFGVISLLHWFLQRTITGKAIRAAAEDAEAANLAGINIQRFYMLTLALSAALSGLAGSLVIIGYGITPTVGVVWLLRGLIVVVLAGTGSIFGTFSAGILLGLVEAISSTLFGAASREIVGLVMFLVVLVLRPQGLFGKKG
ncbi:MAG: branched-chain amino acid ABC transporter permease [Anaerolineae bacterium]|nr:branched-chain amino acid ABC transporter permease [Anaerolineae bacterium]